MKTYQLKKGDKVVVGGEVYEFLKMDGMYGQWLDSKGEVVIGSFDNLELNGEYYEPKTDN